MEEGVEDVEDGGEEGLEGGSYGRHFFFVVFGGGSLKEGK